MMDRPIARREFLGVLGGAAAAGAFYMLPKPLGTWLRPGVAEAALRGLAFPVNQEMAGRILAAACARGAGFADLYCETRVVTRINLADQRIESCEQGIFAGTGVRAVDGDRVGFAYADSFDEAPIVSAAGDAASIASAGAGWTAANLAFTRPAPGSIVKVVRPFDEVPVEERIAWLRRIDAAARAVDPAIQVVNLEYNDEAQRFLVATTDGAWAEDFLPNMYLRINVVAVKDGRRGMGNERISFRMGAEQMDGDVPEKGAREAARMALAMLEAGDAPTGEMPVILGAGGGVLFHEAVGHGLEADAVCRGTSMFAGKVGETVASERVSVVDGGALPNLRGSYNYDDEGQPPQQSVLIENGVLRRFMNDRTTALQLKVPRSGNGRRQSYRFPPLVRMSNTYLAEGTDTVEEIIRGTKSGLFARVLGGGEVDTTTGNFTFGVLEGYKIEDGKVGAPVRGATLVGSGPETMKRIDRVAADQKFWNGTCGKGQWVPVTSGAPTLRISAMTVGGSGQA
jgi:TldD protein